MRLSYPLQLQEQNQGVAGSRERQLGSLLQRGTDCSLGPQLLDVTGCKVLFLNEKVITVSNSHSRKSTSYNLSFPSANSNAQTEPSSPALIRTALGQHPRSTSPPRHHLHDGNVEEETRLASRRERRSKDKGWGRKENHLCTPGPKGRCPARRGEGQLCVLSEEKSAASLVPGRTQRPSGFGCRCPRVSFVFLLREVL